MNAFIEHLKLKRLRPKTIEAYVHDVQYLLIFNQNIPAIRRYLTGLSDAYHARILQTWHQYLNFKGDNYLKSLTIPKVKQGIAEVLNSKEREQFLFYLRNKVQGDLRVFCELALCMGLRASEIMELTEESIRGEWLMVNRKGGRVQRLPIPKELAPILHGFNGVKRSHRQMDRGIKRIASIIGINRSISPHTLRHTFATFALNHGANVVHIKEFLGHSSLNTTQRYLHVEPEHLKEVFNER